jgi:acyl carrier protein
MFPSALIMDTLTTIKELAAKQFGGEREAIHENVPVDQLGIDSLGFLEFLFELEDKFALTIAQESVAHVRTLGELAIAIDGLIAVKAASPAAPGTTAGPGDGQELPGRPAGDGSST